MQREMGTKNKRSGRGAKFYVNGTTGSDAIDAGRGENASKPFKTIQACIDYVSDNYNVGANIVSIMIASGEYNEALVLGDYTRTSGYIVLRSADTNNPATIYTNNNTATIRLMSSSLWYLRNLIIKCTCSATTGTANLFVSTITVNNGGTLRLIGNEIHWKYEGAAPEEGKGKIVGRMIGAAYRSYIYFDARTSSDRPCKLVFNKGNTNTLHVLFMESVGSMEFVSTANTNSDLVKISCEGDCSVFAFAKGGSVLNINTGQATHPFFSVPENKTVTGERYYAGDNSRITTNNKGAEYFPGSIAGSVSAATYSYYS